jgi:hypothetical protein
VRAERARDRIRSIGYPAGPGSEWGNNGTVASIDLANVVRASAIPDAGRAAAMQAWIEWSPAALASMERRRAEVRATCIEEIELMRRQFGGAGQAVGSDAPAVMTVDGDQAKRMSELFEMRARQQKEGLEQAVAGRDAIEAVLPEDARATFRNAWLRAASPRAYKDGKDAMPTLDAARALADITDAQRAQIDAIRSAHAARHRELCDRLAALAVLEQQSADSFGEAGPTGPKKEAGMSTTDTRFERSELNARSLRRLKAMLTPEQVRAIPALARTAAKDQATVSPAPTPAAPAPKSP